MIFKVELHLTSHILGFLTLSRECWVEGDKKSVCSELRAGQQRGRSSSGKKGKGTHHHYGARPWAGSIRESDELGVHTSERPLASCPRTAPPPLLHVCWLHPRVPPSAPPSVAEPLFLRINTVKQLSARVTPQKVSEPQAISSGPFEPQHRAYY